MKKVVKFHHYLAFGAEKFIGFIYTRLFMGYRCKEKYRIKKDEKVVILANHQTDLDPFCVMSLVNKPIFPVATDSIFSGKFKGRLFDWFGVIPKKKGSVDIKTVMKMTATLNGGGSLLLFPEGNRTYAEFQYHIAPTLAKFIKRSGATLILFNLHGGTGISPRFKRSLRSGRFYGKIKEVITPPEYAEMDDDVLFNKIKDGVRVYDSRSGENFKSSTRAEYLERMLFVCPVCGKMQTIYSSRHEVFCKNCGSLAEFTEDLHFKPIHEKFTFTEMIEWWNFQKKAMRDIPIRSGETIFTDDGVKLYSANPYKNKVKLAKGTLSVTDSQLICKDKTLDVKKISGASVISGRKLSFTIDKNDFLIVGDKRFNPLKYAFLFNKLDTEMHSSGSDKYFNLEDDN